MQTAAETPRNTLKRDIIFYLKSAGVTDRELWAKSLKILKESAFDAAIINPDIKQIWRKELKALNLKDGEEFYPRVTQYFSPRHYSTLVAFVKRLEIIEEVEMQAAMKIEEQIETEIQEQFDPLGDSEYDELGAPDFAVVAYADRIEVRAYAQGMGEILPKKGRKYIGCQGNIRWQYPVSALAELQGMGRPVVKVSDLA